MFYNVVTLENTCLMPYGNNRGSHQHEHARSLINAFVFRFLDSIIHIIAISIISSS